MAEHNQREIVARAIYAVTVRWVQPNFPVGHKLKTFDELDEQEQRLNLEYADAAIAAQERELAALIARYYRREIGTLMQQAEHWAAENYPLAVHHRVTKADVYFQFVAFCERCGEFDENPFEKMRQDLARPPIKPPGAYPASAEIHAYREPAFVVEKLKTASPAAGGPRTPSPKSVA